MQNARECNARLWTGLTVEGEVRIKIVNGTLLWLWVGAEDLRDPSGKNVIGATLAAIDISERKALTEAMLKIAIAERLTGEN